MQLEAPEGLTAMHLVLAYAGMLIHILFKLAKLSKKPKFTFWFYVKDNAFAMIATFISIPVILIMATDPAIAETLPINNVTAVLAGMQTNSIFKDLMSLFSKKLAQDE